MNFADRALVSDVTARMLLEVKAVLFSADKPYFLRNSSCVVACSMNWSGQPMRTTGVVMRASAKCSSTVLP